MNYYSNEEIIKRNQKKEKIIEKIKLVIVIFISIIIVYNISLIVQSVIRPEKTPSWFNTKTFAIISGSMMPEINVGDIVIVKEVKEEELAEGDVISFRRDSEIITHRIQKIETENNETHYITKGDNNKTKDETPVKYNEIEGRVERIVPNLGRIVIFLKNKTTILALFLVFIVMYTHDMRKTRKRNIREKKKELLNKERNESYRYDPKVQ